MKLGGTEDKTGIFERPAGESRVFNVSVRGWLALIIVGTACSCALSVVLAAVSVSILKSSLTPLSDPTVGLMFGGIKELGIFALGYYFAKDKEEHLRKKPPLTP